MSLTDANGNPISSAPAPVVAEPEDPVMVSMASYLALDKTDTSAENRAKIERTLTDTITIFSDSLELATVAGRDWIVRTAVDKGRLRIEVKDLKTRGRRLIEQWQNYMTLIVRRSEQEQINQAFRNLFQRVNAQEATINALVVRMADLERVG